MEPTSRSRSSIAIGAIVAKHSGIVSQLLIAAHAISGCDKVGCYLGIGKTKVIKDWSAGIELNHLGDPKANLDDAMKESTHLIGARYGHMYSVRYKVWVSRTGRKGASIIPKLKYIPPTTEAFRENVKRAHFQACIWKACNMIHQSWIHLRLVGHLTDHQVHIAHRHYQVDLTLPLQINLS